MPGPFTQAYDQWRLTGDVSMQFGDTQPEFVPIGPDATFFFTNEQFATEAERQLEEISKDTDPDRRWGLVHSVVNFVSSRVPGRPSLLDSLGSWLQKLRGTLLKLARDLHASGFTVSASVTGISISLSFSIT